jgi:predicted CXXCH cytochrome family protein
LARWLAFARQQRPTASRRALLLVVLALLALPASAFAVSPHAGSAEKDTCASCHVPHKAATASGIFKDVGPVKGETPLCYTCHDGAGATGNVKTGPDSFYFGNGHVLEGMPTTSSARDLTNSCSDCHKPHGDPALLPSLPGSKVNSATVGTTGNVWCFACHDDAQSWYAKRGSYPALSGPSRDASGYPVAGTFAGASVYASPTANAHSGIPARSGAATRTAGDCLYCHNAHGSASRYDSLSATFSPSSASSVAGDRATGAYAALCFTCHGGGSWEASGAANIKRYVTHEATDTSALASGGHRIKSAGAKLPVDSPLPCYDCHNPHGSSRGNKRLISDALGASLDTSAGPEAVRRFCLTCHVTSETLGWDSVAATYTAVPASATVEGLRRDGGANGSGPGGSGKNWLYLKSTPGHARADITMSCYECHGSEYGTDAAKNVHDPGAYSVAIHTGTPSAASITILGQSYGPYACATCHSVELAPEHAKPTSANNALGCAVCHPTPRSSLSPSWNRSTCAQNDCHAGASTAPMHAEKDADHVAPTNACTVSGCHTASRGLASIHSLATTTVAGVTRTSCDVCHAAGVPATRECATCHAGDPHPGVSHTVGGPCVTSGCHATDATTIHAPGPACDACHAEGVTPSFACRSCHATPHTEANHGTADACVSCHSTGNVMGVHGDDCSTCHPTPAQGTTYSGGCSQTGCHPTPHSSLAGYWGPHDGNHGEGDDCWDCHEDWGGCTDYCHTHEYERNTPITTSDARASYMGTAFIRLTPVDVGGWRTDPGIKTTYFQVDGQALQIGTQVLVPGPASGTATHTLEFWSIDGLYNTETHHIVSFRITAGGPDTNPPTGTMSVNAGAAYANAVAVTMNSSVVDGETGVVSMRVDQGTGTFGAWVSYAPSYAITLPAGNGTKTVRAEYKDVAGNVLLLSDTIILDTVAPAGAMVVNSSASYTNSTAITINSSVTDALSGMLDMRVQAGLGYTAWVPYSATLAATMSSGNGMRTVDVQYRDVAGNVVTIRDWITLDTGPPTGTMSVNSNATYATTAAVTLNSVMSDPYSNVTQMRIDPGSGTFGSWVTYNATYAFTLSAGDGTKTVVVEYRDGAGNVSTRSDTIILDTTAPVGTMVVASGAATTAVTAVNVNSSMSDATSGLYQMRVDPGTGTYGSWITYAATYAITLPTGDGIKTVRVEYKDNAGLVSARTDTISLETGPPDTEPPTGSISINAGAASTNTTSVALTLAASDTGGTGVAQMRFSNDLITWSTWETFATSKSWTLTASEGAKTVYAQFRDAAGNSSITYSDDILYSATGTVATTTLEMTDSAWVDAELGASGGWGTFSIYADGVLIGTKAADATSTWSCPETVVSSGARIDIVANVGFTNPGFIWDQNVPITYSTYLPAGSTLLTAAVWTGFPDVEVNDSWLADYDSDFTYVLVPPATIGNITYRTALDTTPPTGSIVINGGAASTSTNPVTLSIAASDPGGTGVALMRFSNDLITWSTWETFATSKSWTLPGADGAKTVYAQFRDAAGNTSATYSDGITLSAGGMATLMFRWWGYGYADLHVENASGVTIATTSVSGSLDELSWYVSVPSGQDYYMVCDYYWDDDWETEGGGYGIWSSHLSINPDGILSPGETVIWNY